MESAFVPIRMFKGQFIVGVGIVLVCYNPHPLIDLRCCLDGVVGERLSLVALNAPRFRLSRLQP